MKAISITLLAIVVVCCHLATPVAALTTAATKCAAGYSPSVTACRAPSVQGTPAAGAGICCSCPLGSYSDGTACKRCTNGLVAQSGVDLQKWGAQCFCLDGFGDYDPIAMTCGRCPINTYSSNSKCIPCAAGTFAAAQSSACAVVKCPADSYLPPGGATVADCTRCKFGTAGQSCANVQGCRCLSGYAGFDKNTGMCQQCSNSNAIAVYTNFDKPDETNTTCYNCPTGSIASIDRRTCEAPKTTSTTSGTNKLAVVSLPYPASPIPSITCSSDCKNGYDMTASFINSKTPGKTASKSRYAVDQLLDNFDETKVSNILSTDLTNPYILIADPASKIIHAVIEIYETRFRLQGSNTGGTAANWVSGYTCADATKAYIKLSGAACIEVPQGDSLSSIVPLIQGKGLAWPIISNDWDLQFKWKCASNMPYVKCAPALVFSFIETKDKALFLTSSEIYGTTASGGGSSNFGTKVIAFTDDSNTVVVVMAKPVNSKNGNIYVTKSNANVAKKCKVEGDVAACIPVTTQYTPLNEIMNAVAPNAMPTRFTVAGLCWA